MSDAHSELMDARDELRRGTVLLDSEVEAHRAAIAAVKAAGAKIGNAALQVGIVAAQAALESAMASALKG